MEDSDEGEVMIGEVQVNEEVEHRKSEVSVTEVDDWQQKEYEGILRKLQPQNDFMSFLGVPSSVISMQEHQLQCRSIRFWQNASHNLRLSMFPLRTFMRR